MFSRLLLATCLAAGSLSVFHGVRADDLKLVNVEIEYLDQPDSIWGTLFWFGFHDGTFATYERGEHASAALRAFIDGDGSGEPLVTTRPMREALLAHQSDAVTDGILAGPAEHTSVDFQTRARGVWIDPLRDRFFSYLARITPSDDAFVGNESPNAVEVFNESGQFLGPIDITVWGSQVLDAGLRQNMEQALALLDNQGVGPGPSGSPSEDEPIRLHPGFNGSVRNPQGTPVRILGGTLNDSSFPLHYDRVRADFTRPNFPIMRIRITSAGIDGEYSGNWFSPERSGEGLSIEVSNSANPVMVVEWYTFTADGSGTPIWLGGSAPINPDGISANVDMYYTTGGIFGSTDNPTLVQHRKWGSILIGFSNCRDGGLTYYPDDPAFSAGGYYITRLAPEWHPMSYHCGAYALDAQDPAPVP